jgi:hypothetical protein
MTLQLVRIRSLTNPRSEVPKSYIEAKKSGEDTQASSSTYNQLCILTFLLLPGLRLA